MNRKILLDALGPNDAPSTKEEIAQHRNNQEKTEMNKPNPSVYLHFPDKKFLKALRKDCKLVGAHSFGMGENVTIRHGMVSKEPVWIIENPHGESAVLCNGPDAGATDQRQPFGTDCFSYFGLEILKQTISESDLSLSCDIGNNITMQYGTRDGSPIWIMQNTDPEGMSAAWYDTED
jgi:hypothetical protein